ncbi:hypothetical protein V6N11_035645 [Hibiscus sabdariffa]|uniref:RNase H type-1 domain-containing protein n=1 Tax=Hibiscus sabdariffa TaxID=183260 RepID=A0ABR2NHW2_9ROSI
MASCSIQHENVADAFMAEALAFDRSVICPIVHNIKILSKDFSSISFCFVRRGANKATHALAHECGSNHGPCYWIEKAPVATMTECGLDRSRLVQVHVP